MSPTATRGSRSSKSSKTTDRKTVHKPPTGSRKSAAAVRPPRTAEKAVRPHKPAKAEVHPKTKPTPRATVGEAKKKRVTEVKKPKKTSKAAPAPKGTERPKSIKPKKASTAETPVIKAFEKPESVKPRRGRKPGGEESAREKRLSARTFPVSADEPKEDLDVVEEYLEESIALEDDELVIPEELDIELDPMEIPLELLDPELVDVPRPTPPPKPKPKLPKAERRAQTCAGCGQSFPWLSVEGLCFNCLKKKLAQRKRDDDGFTSYASEPEEDDEG